MLWPAHDYNGFSCSTVGEERRHNPRFTRSEDEFVQLMQTLDLRRPSMIDKAVPWNLNCGVQPDA